MNTELKPANAGIALIDEWESAKLKFRRANIEVANASNRLREAERKIAEWVLPKDARTQEKFMVAYGAKFLVVSFNLDKQNPIIEWRLP